MNLVKITCPNCGAAVERKKDDFFGTCPFCGIEIGFDEMKEEVQFTEMQNRINYLENQERANAANRIDTKKWLKIVKTVFSIMALLTFLGFTLIGLSPKDTEETSGLTVIGSLLLTMVLCIGVFSPFGLGSIYPGDADTFSKQENLRKVRFRMSIKLLFTAAAICFLTAFVTAIIFTSFIYKE